MRNFLVAENSSALSASKRLILRLIINFYEAMPVTWSIFLVLPITAIKNRKIKRCEFCIAIKIGRLNHVRNALS